MVLVSQYITELTSTSQNKCLNKDVLGGTVQQRKAKYCILPIWY
jgi:hypothetical protein